MDANDYLDERADWAFRDQRNDAMVPAILQESATREAEVDLILEAS